MNIEMEKRAIECLKAFEPQDEQGYYLCYSGANTMFAPLPQKAARMPPS